MAKPPVFLLAFANDHADDARYLRNLREERRRIKEALRAVRDQHLCEIVECASTTVKELFDECQAYADRLSAFHFGGHADGKTLLFEDRDGAARAANARSIAEFLAGLPRLQLIVLNGCSTTEQVDSLLRYDIRAVVATSRAVKDAVATEFAARLYGAIAGSVTIENAFRQASGATKTEYCSGIADEQIAMRAVCRDAVASELGEPSSWPWEVHGTPEARSAILIASATPVGGRGVPPWLVAVACAAVLAGGYATYRVSQAGGPAPIVVGGSAASVGSGSKVSVHPPPTPDDASPPADAVEVPVNPIASAIPREGSGGPRGRKGLPSAGSGSGSGHLHSISGLGSGSGSDPTITCGTSGLAGGVTKSGFELGFCLSLGGKPPYVSARCSCKQGLLLTDTPLIAPDKDILAALRERAASCAICGKGAGR